MKGLLSLLILSYKVNSLAWVKQYVPSFEGYTPEATPTVAEATTPVDVFAAPSSSTCHESTTNSVLYTTPVDVFAVTTTTTDAMLYTTSVDVFAVTTTTTTSANANTVDVFAATTTTTTTATAVLYTTPVDVFAATTTTTSVETPCPTPEITTDPVDVFAVTTTTDAVLYTTPVDVFAVTTTNSPCPTPEITTVPVDVFAVPTTTEIPVFTPCPTTTPEPVDVFAAPGKGMMAQEPEPVSGSTPSPNTGLLSDDKLGDEIISGFFDSKSAPAPEEKKEYKESTTFSAVNNVTKDEVVCRTNDFCKLNGYSTLELLGNGTQKRFSSCSETIHGVLPSVENMVSVLITSPENGAEIALGSNVTVVINSTGIEFGFFDEPSTDYYLKPQTLNEQGQIQGHTHIAVQLLSGNTVPDPKTPLFFKGLNDPAVNGVLNFTIPGASVFNVTGIYRICTSTASSSHAPVLMPVARRGFADDCVRVSVA